MLRKSLGLRVLAGICTRERLSGLARCVNASARLCIAGRIIGLMLLASAIFVFGACSKESTLKGSLTEVIDLGFSDVSFSTSETEFSLSYYRKNGESEDIVFKLAVTVAPSDVFAGAEIDLGPALDGTQRASASRSVTDDLVHNYASIKRGTISIESIDDKQAAGSFRVTLDEGGDIGRGRTAFGEFLAKKK